MSAKSEAADAAEKLVTKGALHLIRWGKKIIPATADEIAEFGPNAARVKGLFRMVDDVSEDAGKLSDKARRVQEDLIDKANHTAIAASRNTKRLIQLYNVDNIMGDTIRNSIKRAQKEQYENRAFYTALRGEAVSDLIRPETYRILTNPIAAARRFDITVPNAPESFTNIARSLGERGFITGPKDIELARRVSMLPPAMQQVYLDLVGEGTDPAQLLQALRLMGQ